ncbi:hypothetical protein QUF86_17770 [Peribacillus sp. NJ11]|nr:hypothetical protein [Peribacillus sp. NJ11]MDM5222561.1 hypothetical protein [Peribacillus sp. NJ11]
MGAKITYKPSQLSKVIMHSNVKQGQILVPQALDEDGKGEK